MRLQAEDLLRQLEEGMPVSELAHYVRTLRTPIGYIPPESDEADGVPYRGNGMANIIGNACFRPITFRALLKITRLCYRRVSI